MFSFELFSSPYGTGYRLRLDGQIVEVQPYKPGVSGFQGMSADEAASRGQAECDKRNGVPQ